MIDQYPSVDSIALDRTARHDSGDYVVEPIELIQAEVARAVCWAPDGNVLAVGHADGSIEAHTVDGQIRWRTTEHTGEVLRVSWSNDGGRLASTSADGSVLVWNTFTGRLLSRRRLAIPVCAICWSPDARWLAHGNRSGTVSVVDVARGREDWSEAGHIGEVDFLDWLKPGDCLVSAAQNEPPRLWDGRYGKRLQVASTPGRKFAVVSSGPSPIVACVAKSNTAWIWNTFKGSAELPLEREVSGTVTSIAGSPVGGLLAVATDEGSIDVFEVQYGQHWQCCVGCDAVVYDIVFSPSGSILAALCADGVRLWRLLDSPHASLGFSADGGASAAEYFRQQAASVGRVLATESPTWLPKIRGSDENSVGMLKGAAEQFSPQVVLFPDARSLATGHPEGWLRRWDLEKGAMAWEARSDHERVRQLAVSAQGNRIATASGMAPVRIWDADTGECLRQFRGHRGTVWSVGWSPDGTRLVSSASDRSVRVWDVESGSTIKTCDGHQSDVKSVSWSPDNQFLASASYDKTLRIWDPDSGGCVQMCVERDRVFSFLRWSPLGRFLASCSGNEWPVVNIWDIQSGEIVLECDGHAKGVMGVAWSPEGSLLASIAHDQQVRVWDAATGGELARFWFPEKYGYSVDWSSDGAFLVSGHEGDVVRFWDVRELFGSYGVAIAQRAMQSWSHELQHLPAALAQLHRLGIFPPLSLLRDLLRLTGGEIVQTEYEPLIRHPGIQSLVRLRWPLPSRIGLVAMLLHGLPMVGWEPPTTIPPNRVRTVTSLALRGKECESATVPVPLALLIESAQTIDSRLLMLLNILGPKEVANDPGLPLRLRHRVHDLPPLTSARRRLLVADMVAESRGASTGLRWHDERGGVVKRGNLHSILPSEFVNSSLLFAYRYLRHEILYRASQGDEPPRLRPVVLLLDVSPPTFGPVEAVTRMAAHTVAHALQEARLPVILVTAGGEGNVHYLTSPSDLIELWAQRSLQPAIANRSLQLARVMRQQLRGGALDAVVLLLTHPWFGTEEDLVRLPHLRALFVNYPSTSVRPALADICERWRSVTPSNTTDLVTMLAELIA